QAISDALASILRGHGGKVFVGSPVRSLRAFEDAAAIVMDLTPRQILKFDGTRFPSHYLSRLQAYRYGPGVFKMEWALAGPIPWRAPEWRKAGTIHLGPGSREIVESAAAAWYGRPDPDPFIILAQSSLFDSSRCPAGQHTAWAYCHVPNGSTE